MWENGNRVVNFSKYINIQIKYAILFDDLTAKIY